MGRDRQLLGAAFRSGASDYERLRPSYPLDTVRWLVGYEPIRIADVGAGTGKLTGVLHDLGHEVVAVEPSPDMAARLAEAVPDVRVSLGTGEHTGLAGHCVDAVVYGQAWHWVDPVAASAEAARVLTASGRLALIWNFVDLADERMVAFNAAMHDLDPVLAENEDSAEQVGAPFVLEEQRDFRWNWRTTTADLAELVTTRSYYLVRAAAEQEHLRQLCGRVVAERFGPIGSQPIDVPQRTVAYRFALAVGGSSSQASSER